MSRISELFTFPVTNYKLDWESIVQNQFCKYTQKRCFKVRKSEPSISIGTCIVKVGKDYNNIVICPHRLLQNNQIFFDCIHLLSTHEPGNELHIVPEVSIPGGNVDYFLVSTDSNRNIKDFVGIELQTMDTTGSVWTERENALYQLGINTCEPKKIKSFGINWKMTAKTILVQLHHKVETFQSINKHLVLVVQDCLLEYIKNEFSFSHIHSVASIGDSMHIHSYGVLTKENSFKLFLKSRHSTDSIGISKLLGLQASANLGLEELMKILQSKISDSTLLKFNECT